MLVFMVTMCLLIYLGAKRWKWQGQIGGWDHPRSWSWEALCCPEQWNQFCPVHIFEKWEGRIRLKKGRELKADVNSHGHSELPVLWNISSGSMPQFSDKHFCTGEKNVLSYNQDKSRWCVHTLSNKQHQNWKGRKGHNDCGEHNSVSIDRLWTCVLFIQSLRFAKKRRHICLHLLTSI